jgi:flagellar biogenesis protein FliO
MLTSLDTAVYPLARLPGPLRKSASGVKMLASAALGSNNKGAVSG